MKLQQLMKDKNITQQELAEKLQVHQTAISNWVNGKNKPKLDKLLVMAELFEMSIDELFNMFF